MMLRLWVESDPPSTKDWFRHEGPDAFLFEHGPTHGRVYLHVLFCDLFRFIGISFALSLVSLKPTLTAVCEPRSTIGFDCIDKILHVML